MHFGEFYEVVVLINLESFGCSSSVPPFLLWLYLSDYNEIVKTEYFSSFDQLSQKMDGGLIGVLSLLRSVFFVSALESTTAISHQERLLGVIPSGVGELS